MDELKGKWNTDKKIERVLFAVFLIILIIGGLL